MFLDFNVDRRWEDAQSCMSCKGLITSGQPTEQVRLPFDPHHRTHELNGIYHSECARPYLSMVRAMNALTRWSF